MGLTYRDTNHTRGSEKLGVFWQTGTDTAQDNAAVLAWVGRFLPVERRQLLLFLAQQDVTTVRFGDVCFDMYAPRIQHQ